MSYRSKTDIVHVIAICYYIGHKVTLLRRQTGWAPYVGCMLILMNIGCNQTQPHQKKYIEYLESLEELISHQGIESDYAKTQAYLSVKVEDSPRLVTKKLRRYQIPAAPRMNVRDFMKIANCSIAQQIAFRNSPLGRVMLPSQTLAYQYRFLRTAKACRVEEGRLKKEVEAVIRHKESHWSEYHWNAIWSGNKIAKFFSTSWPRNYKIRGLDAADEARFLWLGRLTPTMEVDFSSELELQLSDMPSYVGGQILLRAHHTLLFLKKSIQILRDIEINRKELSSVLKSKLCDRFQITLDLFGQLQGVSSRVYQDLVRLQGGLRPLLFDDHYPSSQMTQFVNRWLSDHNENSVSRQLKALSRDNVNQWLRLQERVGCT